MAGKSVSKVSRVVALAIEAKTTLETAHEALGEIRGAIGVWADELTVDPENAHQSAVGLQAEAVRIVVAGLAVRAAAERMAIVAQLAQDATGGAS